jgi:hypothetical protein
MAEDDLDFADEDLELDDDSGGAGDGFAGELDDMMGDDELGGGGGADNDSELDSFFEDLSSIEDMDEGSGDTDSGSESIAAAPVTAETDKKAGTVKEEKKASKSKNKLKLILPLVLLLLVGAGAGSYILFLWDPQPEPTEATDLTPPITDILPPEKTIRPEFLPTPKFELESQPAEPTPAPAPPQQFLVQVATCTYDSCKDEFIRWLREDGEPVYQKTSGEKYDFIELISRQMFTQERANELVREINRKNKMAGNASVRDQSNGYRISMGTFPALDRAKEIKFHIEQLFPVGTVIFNMEHVRKDYTTTKIYAGPYNSRNEAKDVLEVLRRKQRYQGAFIVQTTEPI